MSQKLPMAIQLNPEASLSAYIRTANNMPMLSAEKERELATQFREDDDLEAARQLVMSQLRYVVRVARGLSGYGLPHYRKPKGQAEYHPNHPLHVLWCQAPYLRAPGRRLFHGSLLTDSLFRRSFLRNGLFRRCFFACSLLASGLLCRFFLCNHVLTSCGAASCLKNQAGIYTKIWLLAQTIFI